MKIILTRTDGLFITVESDAIKLIEPMADGSTHLVFGADLGRTVKETPAQLNDAMGAIKLPPIVVV
jgi:hypothetical protein